LEKETGSISSLCFLPIGATWWLKQKLNSVSNVNANPFGMVSRTKQRQVASVV
jgi:hypothetical protein